MQSSNIPGVKWIELWAKNAPLTNVRTIPQTTATTGFASQDQGFPPECAKPIAAGGVPPFIQDMNGALQFVSSWVQWMTAGGGLVPWDSSFSASIGGYPKGAVVLSATTFGAAYISTAENNVTNPDSGGAGWQAVSLFGTATTGDVKLSYKTTADFLWVPMNDGSIGNAGSGATTLADPSTQPLFSLMYNNITDANAPIQTSGGGATTRGAQGSAATAFGNLCRLVLPKMLGRSLAAAGAGSGLTSRALGSNVGEETHLMTIGELVAHTHTWGYGLTPIGSTGSQQADRQNVDNHNTSGSTGGGTPFNVMQPTTFLNPFVKL